MQNLNLLHTGQNLLASNGFICLPKFHITFSDNNNAAFYYFSGVFIIMFILTVLAYGVHGVGIIVFTLKMRTLKLRDVTQLVRIGQAHQKVF